MPSVPSGREAGTESVRLHLIAALSSELACLTPAMRSRWPVTRCGPGAAAAAAAARTVIAGGVDGLVIWGFAGGVQPGLAPGTLVLPGRVKDSPHDGPVATDSAWRRRIAALLPEALPVSEGDLCSVAAVLTTPVQKRAFHAATAAVAVDQESAAIGRVAAASGVPFVVVKIVLDGADDALPVQALRWVDSRGRSRVGALLADAWRPALWQPLAMLLRRYGRARAGLRDLAAVLAAHDLGWPDRPRPVA
jgi:adenosylhomocysteine nucleosidase